MFAKDLRKRMTLAEKILWKELRERSSLKIRRQVPIGIYIVDFLCVEHRLVIEVDGPIHNAQLDYDRTRDEELRTKGYAVLRFANDEVMRDRTLVRLQIEEAARSPLR